MMPRQAVGADDLARRTSRSRDSVFVSVQYLRGIASLMIVLYHVGYDLHFVTEHGRAHWLASGVDIFFVISGFVMIVSTSERPVEARTFMISRLSRVAPLYWLATMIMVAILYVRGQMLPSVDELLKSLFFIFYFNPRVNEISPVLGPGWTLNYEIYFYLIFAALLRVPTTWRVVAIAILFILIASLRLVVPPENTFLVRMTSPIPLEFVAGMVIGRYREKIMRAPRYVGVGAIVCGLLALALFDPPVPRLVFFAPLAALIVMGAIICEPASGRRRIGFLDQLGKSSYSLYLVHPLILAMLTPIVLADAWTLPAGILLVAVSIAFGLIAYYFCEVPLTRGTRTLLTRAVGRRYPAGASADRPPPVD